jgi:mono/diheme cytochrome c family protein
MSKGEPMRRVAHMAALVALTALLSACDVGLPAGRTPHREGNYLDMVDQPKLKPQRKDIFNGRPTGLLEPQLGSVAVVAHGKFVFEHVCITCHGPRGAGDGHVTALFPKPPSLMTQKVRDWPDGQLFHRPMRGQNSMPSHARQVDARDIWSVILYIRDMQKVEPVSAPPPTATGSGGATTGPASAAPPPVSGSGAATAGQARKGGK